jgi:hypothetical protein
MLPDTGASEIASRFPLLLNLTLEFYNPSLDQPVYVAVRDSGS